MRSSHDRSTGQTLDLGRRLATDRHLQAEIDKGIESLAGGLPAPVGLRLARVLRAVLEPSWSEHTDFQGEALFPIIAKSEGATAETRTLLERLEREHAEIGERHREVSAFLTSLVAGRRVESTGLSPCLMQALELRRRHHDAEAALAPMIPAVLDAADRAALKHWESSRVAPAFPVNLILDFWE